jgi:hypothetical protein
MKECQVCSRGCTDSEVDAIWIAGLRYFVCHDCDLSQHEAVEIELGIERERKFARYETRSLFPSE